MEEELGLDSWVSYLFKKESRLFFVGVAIRHLAIGMIGIFEPIYIYLAFGKSLTYTMIFFATSYGLFGLLAVFGGRIMAKFGIKKTILVSNLIFFVYYICLLFINKNAFLPAVAIILRSIGLTLFWPGFHTYFIRFTNKETRSVKLGQLEGIFFIVNILGPMIGGLLLTTMDYTVLFVIVLITLSISMLPLLMSKERHEVYSDTYRGAWKRIFKNRKTSVALSSEAVELSTSEFLWPLFMFTIGLSYKIMGSITTIGFIVSAILSVYIGKLLLQKNRTKMLAINSPFVALAWIIKSFVVGPLTALLSRIFYYIFKVSADVPFQSMMYDKAELHEDHADEFIIYREIIMNFTRLIYYSCLALIFFFVPNIRIAFAFATIASLGFFFMSKDNIKILKNGFRYFTFQKNR